MAIGDGTNSILGNTGSLTISNTGADQFIIQPGNSWLSDGTGTLTTTDAAPNLGDSELGRSVTKLLVTTSCKIEELFEYRYRIFPEVDMYGGYVLSYHVSIVDNEFAPDPTTPTCAWQEPLISSVRGDADGNMRDSEHLHATAKMIYAALCFRAGYTDHTGSRTEPSDVIKTFIYQVAKAYVFEDSEMPDEPLGKLALLQI